MQCSCEIDIDTDCRADVFDAKIVAARKPNRCCECHKSIEKGERHERAKGLWEGEWGTYRTCLSCLSVRKTMFRNGYYFEMLWEDVIDFVFETDGISEDCISKLHPEARDRLCEIIERGWDD